MFLRNVGWLWTDRTALKCQKIVSFITTAVRTSNPTHLSTWSLQWRIAGWLMDDGSGRSPFEVLHQRCPEGSLPHRYLLRYDVPWNTFCGAVTRSTQQVPLKRQCRLWQRRNIPRRTTPTQDDTWPSAATTYTRITLACICLKRPKFETSQPHKRPLTNTHSENSHVLIWAKERNILPPPPPTIHIKTPYL
jgi:hypothetical protein